MDDEKLDWGDLQCWEVEPLASGLEDRVVSRWERALRQRRIVRICGAAIAAAGLGTLLVSVGKLQTDEKKAPVADVAVKVVETGKRSFVSKPDESVVVRTPLGTVLGQGAAFSVEVRGGVARSVVLEVEHAEVMLRSPNGDTKVGAGDVAIISDHGVRVEPIAARRSRVQARAKQAILRAFAQRQAASAVGPEHRAPSGTHADEPAEGEEHEPALDPDYVRGVVTEELMPLAWECVEALGDERLQLHGRMNVVFSIVGDASVGGVVDSVELRADDGAEHPALRECLVETTKTLVFAPPLDGGQVRVTVPLTIASQ